MQRQPLHLIKSSFVAKSPRKNIRDTSQARLTRASSAHVNSPLV